MTNPHFIEGNQPLPANTKRKSGKTKVDFSNMKLPNSPPRRVRVYDKNITVLALALHSETEPALIIGYL
ncbi:hypothetical protein J6590_101726 [Homalodisca vitripennis]|nr:hypothetical protein J6590_101726 [Homalodisca vitripennis]